MNATSVTGSRAGGGELGLSEETGSADAVLQYSRNAYMYHFKCDE